MCDTIAVVLPSGVLFAKNSDRDANEAQLLDWREAEDHPEGEAVRCTWMEIPQARRTCAVLLSRPFWTWGAEMGANEHGVAIGNEAVFTRARRQAVGLTGMDLVRLALERALSAAQAVEVIASLLRRHGQGGGCGYEDPRFTYDNSFIAADPREAFVVETAGRELEVERVAGGARSISNGLTIGPFARRHADRLRGNVACCELRRGLTERAARGARGPADLMAALRLHGERRWPSYAFLKGSFASPCMHGGGALASAHTNASWVSELRQGGQSRHWVTATSTPCLSAFKPVRVGEPLPMGPLPEGRADGGSLFWAHERLQRKVMRDPERLAPLFLAERDAAERRWLASPPPPAAAFAEHRRLLDRWSAQVDEAMGPERRDTRPLWARSYWRRRERAAAGR